MKHYKETLSNINALQSSRDLPPFYYKDYIKWNFINGIYITIIFVYCLLYLTFLIAFRTTPVETSLNYIEQLPNIKLPVCLKQLKL